MWTDFRRKEEGYFLKREQYSTDRRTKRHSNSSRTGSTDDLPSLRFVPIVLGEESRDDVADARCDVDERTFLAERETGADGESETDRFGGERPRTQIPSNDETCRIQSATVASRAGEVAHH